MRVVVLGAGFGGLELTTRLSEEFGDDVDVVLIDQDDEFVFGFSKLEVMFGRAPPNGSAPVPRRREAGRAVRAVDDPRRSTRRRSASRPTPVPSMPTSSSSPSVPISDPTRRPDWSRAGTSSTRSPARSRCVTCLADFDGGRVIVAVTSTPFKCPPAPSETALLMHDFLTERGPARPVDDLAR